MATVFDEGDVDSEQAAEYAAALLDPELTGRCRDLSAELDGIAPSIADLAGRLSGLLEASVKNEDRMTTRACIILHGVDTTMTYPTLERARELLNAWSGHATLWARACRLANVLNGALGLHELLFDDERIEGLLTQERGR